MLRKGCQQNNYGCRQRWSYTQVAQASAWKGWRPLWWCVGSTVCGEGVRYTKVCDAFTYHRKAGVAQSHQSCAAEYASLQDLEWHLGWRFVDEFQPTSFRRQIVILTLIPVRSYLNTCHLRATYLCQGSGVVVHCKQERAWLACTPRVLKQQDFRVRLVQSGAVGTPCLRIK